MPFLAQRSVSIPNKDLLSWMFDDQKYDIDKPIYIDAANPSRSISSRQARILIRKLVAGLHAAGLSPGDCVGIHSFNDIYYPILFLGIIAAGGIFMGTNPGYTPFELSHHIKTSKAKFMITEPETLDSVLVAAKDCNISKSNIWIFDFQRQPLPAGFKSWQELMNYGEKDWIRFDDGKTSKTTTAARLFSSGTTGLPKAAVISHYNLIAQHTLVHEIENKPYAISRIFCLPFFHVSLVPLAHTTPLRMGDVSYVMRRFELEPYLSNVQKYRITELILVPPLVIAITMAPIAKKYSLESVKLAYCGAAPLDKKAQARLKALLSPDAIFNQVWGMTEASCIATMFYYPESDGSGSIGRPIPNLDVKIIDDDGNDITAYNTRGELCIRGPTVILNYFENPAANASSFNSDGFFKTGDIVYCDAKTQKWYIVDRKKELIKVRGFQVAPPELEGVLLQHPQIIDAAVIGVKFPSDPDVERPRAYVVRRPGPGGARLQELEVKAFLRERLARFKQLTGGVVFVEAVPKNPSGKILKRVLRDLAGEELEGKRAKL